MKHYVIESDAPIRDSELCQWMLKLPYAQLSGSTDRELLVGFLAANGYATFDPESVRYVFKDFLNLWRLHNNRYTLAELLTPVAPSNWKQYRDGVLCDEGYYVRGLDSQRYEPTELLRGIIAQANFIFKDIYFEVIRGNRLYGKYSQILGSRALCTITDLGEDN